ncbi:MAG: apolipoprotein N-acyltransferase [Sphingopyxis sp.]|uniref:apolipoprotein N-acyltransferase n=1 Tax=Sphingopyxis sp. TaxID=1908224 RepID=UPI002ABBDD4F|nr:apolipoprotein N-acyltransferase [Sphingopyxis sp.]MDZ3832371.1 apolipoprotein N-acyltransferase [Sphingopyxis sp.]
MTALSSRIAQFADRWPKSLALLLGLVSATGFAPLGLWPLTLIAFASWMLLVAHSQRGRRTLAIGWAFGLGHFALGLNWIATAFTYQAAMPAWLGWIAVLLLSFYLAFFPAMAAWGAWMAVKFAVPAKIDVAEHEPPHPPPFLGASLSFTLAFAALWTLAEWLRSWLFTGFAWNPLSAILVPMGPFALGPTRLVGSYGMSAFVVLIAGFSLRAALRNFPGWYRALGPSFKDGTFPTIIIGGGLIAAAPFFFALSQIGSLGGKAAALSIGKDAVALTLIQPNIGQEDKWEGTKADANFDKLARLTVPRDDKPRLILWPEAAIPDYLESGYPSYYYDRSPAGSRARLAQLMDPGDAMLLGALKLEFDREGNAVGARNAVMTVHSDGSLGPRYDKAHLVPFGEYLPMRSLLSALGLSRLAPGDLDFWPGPGPRTLDLAHFGRAGLQICYEIIFSGQVVDRANRPDYIFNPSNDAWFGAWGPPQHLAQAQLRAIEEGLPVLRSTPTGISAVIDADGRLLASIPMHQAGRIDMTLPPPHAPTLFARFGNAMSVGFALLLIVLAIAFQRRGR